MKRLFALLALLTMLSLFPVTIASAYDDRLVDNADLLTDDEESKLQKRLDDMSEKYDMNVIVVTVPDMGDAISSQDFADLWFENGDYGDDGVLLMISMQERDWALSGTGKGEDKFPDAKLESIGQKIKPKLSNGDYYKAFDLYADQVEMKLAGRIPLYWIGIALAGGALVALIYCSSIKSQLTSVKMQDMADDFIAKDSFHITTSHDTFLYKNTTREYINNDSSRGGGGGHTSSGGGHHSGASGKF